MRREQQLVLHLERDLRSLEKELFLAGDLRLKKEEELDTPWSWICRRRRATI